jgi:hypothetical protein
MKLRTLLTSAALAAGATLAIASQAAAASLVICDDPACGTADPGISFSTNDFEGSFQLNGAVVQIGLGSPNSTILRESGAASPNPIVNNFSGVWILGGPIAVQNETVFFTEAGGGISDVLHYTYTQDSIGRGHLDGFVISDTGSTIDPAFLAGRGIAPTLTVAERGVFRFDNTNISASFQSDVVPEPGAWALMLVGFGGLGAALRMRHQRSATPA